MGTHAENRTPWRPVSWQSVEPHLIPCCTSGSLVVDYVRSCYKGKWLYDLDNNLYREFRYVFMPEGTPVYAGQGIYTSAYWLDEYDRGSYLGDDGAPIEWSDGLPVWAMPPPDPTLVYRAARNCTDNPRVVSLCETPREGYFPSLFTDS